MRVFALAVLLTVAAAADAAEVATARDLRADAALARDQGRVLVLMVSRSDCPYCAVLKREVLRPLLTAGDGIARQIVLRELMLDGPPLVDFDGGTVAATAVAARYGEFLSPTLLFLDSAGRELTERRRGISSLDFYNHYLQRAVRRSLTALAASVP